MLEWKMPYVGVRIARFQSHTFEIEKLTPEETGKPGTVYLCRLDGIAFDAGSTLREAKRHCEVTAENL